MSQSDGATNSETQHGETVKCQVFFGFRYLRGFNLRMYYFCLCTELTAGKYVYDYTMNNMENVVVYSESSRSRADGDLPVILDRGTRRMTHLSHRPICGFTNHTQKTFDDLNKVISTGSDLERYRVLYFSPERTHFNHAYEVLYL
jgi:hypothetical protein